MTNSDDVTTITPDLSIPDEEMRALGAFLEAIKAARIYLHRIADARTSRGLDACPQEADEEMLMSLEMGYGRALDRRKRDVGTLLANNRLRRAVAL